MLLSVPPNIEATVIMPNMEANHRDVLHEVSSGDLHEIGQEVAAGPWTNGASWRSAHCGLPSDLRVQVEDVGSFPHNVETAQMIRASPGDSHIIGSGVYAFTCELCLPAV